MELYRDLYALSVIVHHVLGSAPAESLSGVSITVDQMRVLRFIALNQTLRVGDVANGLGITPSSATLAVDRLEAKGLVERRPGLTDRRTVGLDATGTGQSVVAEFDQLVDAKLQAVTRKVSPETAERLPSILAELINALMDGEDLLPAICAHCGPGYEDTCAIHGTFANCEYVKPDRESGCEKCPSLALCDHRR